MQRQFVLSRTACSKEEEKALPIVPHYLPFFFKSYITRAVRLGYGLIMNHPFVDGNKWIGTHAMLVLLALNGLELRFKQDELSDELLTIAAAKYEYEHLLQWVIDH